MGARSVAGVVIPCPPHLDNSIEDLFVGVKHLVAQGICCVHVLCDVLHMVAHGISSIQWILTVGVDPVTDGRGYVNQFPSTFAPIEGDFEVVAVEVIVDVVCGVQVPPHVRGLCSAFIPKHQN